MEQQWTLDLRTESRREDLVLCHCWHGGWGCCSRSLIPHLAAPAVMFCPGVGAPHFPARRSPQLGFPGAEPNPVFAPFEQIQDSPTLRQLVTPHNPTTPQSGAELSSPSPAPDPIRGGAGAAQRGKSPCRYLQDSPFTGLPTQAAASSRTSRVKEIFMSHLRLCQHRQL